VFKRAVVVVLVVAVESEGESAGTERGNLDPASSIEGRHHTGLL